MSVTDSGAVVNVPALNRTAGKKKSRQSALAAKVVSLGQISRGVLFVF